MDIAGTFFANFMKILLALQDKSVSFHFTKNLDLDELDYFEFISVVCHHRRFFSFVQLFCRLWAESRVQTNTWSWWAYEVAYFLNSPNNKLCTYWVFSMKFWSILWYIINNIIIITEANLVFKMIWFYFYIFWQQG